MAERRKWKLKCNYSHWWDCIETPSNSVSFEGETARVLETFPGDVIFSAEEFEKVREHLSTLKTEAFARRRAVEIKVPYVKFHNISNPLEMVYEKYYPASEALEILESAKKKSSNAD